MYCLNEALLPCKVYMPVRILHLSCALIISYAISYSFPYRMRFNVFGILHITA